MTFDPHPAEIMGNARPKRLLPLMDRVRLLHACGADAIWVVPFDRDFGNLPAVRFIENLLVRDLQVDGVVAGPYSRFGRDRTGDPELLASHAQTHGFELDVVKPRFLNGGRVSSSRIRDLLLQGRVEEAGEMLGRCYRLKGVVAHGRRDGTRLGFPTANIELSDDVLIPHDGVYIVRARLGPRPDKVRSLDGVGSIGIKPTFGEHKRYVEAHLFDVNRELYGETVTLEMIRWLRPQEKFPSLEALKQAIAQDVRDARDYFEASGLREEPPVSRT